MKILRLSLIALTGAWLAQQINLPTPLMLGPIFALFLAKLVGLDVGKAPGTYGELGKILLGTCVGATFNRAVLARLGPLILPSALATLVLIASALLLAAALARITGLSLATALLSLTPGGMAEMVAVADEAQADMAAVAVLQLLRFVMVLLLVPLLIVWLSA